MSTRRKQKLQPLVTVCVPAFEAERYIAATIESVLGQTHSDWELIVLDNNSSDRTSEVAGRAYDDRIQLHRNDDTLDLAENWNRALSFASGKYLKMLCADDILNPRCLEQQVSIMERHADVSLVACRRDFIDDAGKLVLKGRGLSGLAGHHDALDVVSRVVASGINPIGWPGSLLFHTSHVKDVGGFDPTYVAPMDLVLAVALLKKGNFYGIDETLASFRISQNSISSVRRRQGAEHRKVLREVASDPFWKISKLTLLRGLTRSHLESFRKQLLYGAATSSLASLRRLPSVVLRSNRADDAASGKDKDSGSAPPVEPETARKRDATPASDADKPRTAKSGPGKPGPDKPSPEKSGPGNSGTSKSGPGTVESGEDNPSTRSPSAGRSTSARRSASLAAENLVTKYS